MHKISFALTILMSLSLPYLAEAAGKRKMAGSRNWKPEWTQMFMNCFAAHGAPLTKVSPSDSGQYCGRPEMKPNNPQYWLSIFIPLAKKESNFNPNDHTTNKQRKGGAEVNIGLFQMSKDDMKSHRCDKGSPEDPKTNICCAIKIAANLAKKKKNNSSIGDRDKKARGILSAFWQPMRNGTGGDGLGKRTVNNTENHDYIKKESKRLCSTEMYSTLSAGGGPTADSLYQQLGYFPKNPQLQIKIRGRQQFISSSDEPAASR